MLKSTFCLRRHTDMSHEQFVTYWREIHAPLVLEVAAVLGILGYRQVHTTHDQANRGLREARGAPEPYDGVAEAWFADLESALAAFASPDGRGAWKRLAEDERRFIDLEHSPIFFGEEHTIIEPHGGRSR